MHSITETKSNFFFFDISKAFDRVWHQSLIHKLKRIGIRNKLLNWFIDYLKNRKQRVVLDGQFSEWKEVKAGVPQGSILGPLLFLIFINDIVELINTNIRLFADDTSLYLIVSNPNNDAAQLNLDLQTIATWAKQWLVDFNPNKTETMIISRKTIKPIHPPLIMNNIILNQVTSHKHLGIYLSNDGTWHVHIGYIVDKAWKRLNLLRGLKFFLDRYSLEKIYISFVRPILEYGYFIWDNCTNEEKQKLESVQIEGMRIVTGATSLASIEGLYKETGWEKLEDRRLKHKLTLFYKMINRQCPNYLSNLIPTDTRINYNLRNANNLQNIRCRTELYKKSFLPSTINEWNNLPNELKNSVTISSFKNALNPNMLKPPHYYYVGTREGQIYHTRLRLNCSSLRYTLFRKNIIQDPSCQCGAIETVEHYLLYCHNYSDIRNTYITPLPYNLNTNILLFGDTNLGELANRNIFKQVQNYILHTKRFS